jgi:hypothetical protein
MKRTYVSVARTNNITTTIKFACQFFLTWHEFGAPPRAPIIIIASAPPVRIIGAIRRDGAPAGRPVAWAAATKISSFPARIHIPARRLLFPRQPPSHGHASPSPLHLHTHCARHWPVGSYELGSTRHWRRPIDSASINTPANLSLYIVALKPPCRLHFDESRVGFVL